MSHYLVTFLFLQWQRAYLCPHFENKSHLGNIFMKLFLPLWAVMIAASLKAYADESRVCVQIVCANPSQWEIRTETERLRQMCVHIIHVTVLPRLNSRQIDEWTRCQKVPRFWKLILSPPPYLINLSHLMLKVNKISLQEFPRSHKLIIQTRSNLLFCFFLFYFLFFNFNFNFHSFFVVYLQLVRYQSVNISHIQMLC